MSPEGTQFGASMKSVPSTFVFELSMQTAILEIFNFFKVASPAEFMRMFGGNRPIEKVC